MNNDSQFKELKEIEKLYKTLFENTEDSFQVNEVIYDEFGKFLIA